MCNDYSINIDTNQYNVELGNEQDFTITINEQPDIVINLNEQGPQGARGLDGEQGPQGERGLTGNGIAGIEKISQEGYDITYRITYTDGDHYDFVVSNGTGSMKWLQISESDWVKVGDYYRYTYSGSYSVIDLYSGTVSNRNKVECNVDVQGPITYIYSVDKFDGYALCASVENAEVAGVYIHEQVTPSDEWEINHNLNTRPSITIVDSAGDVVEGEEKYVDNNTVIIKFSAPFSGEAYLNYTR